MKIAVISDIHGNLEALKAVLEDIKAQGISKIYCLGDLCFCGPHPKETLDFIREELNDQIIIQGNTDEMIVKSTGSDNDTYMPKNQIMANALKYSQKVLTAEDIEYLNNLPSEYSDQIEELKLLFVHGSPRKNNEGITKDIKYSKLEEMCKDINANIIFCGHTHYPVIHRVQNKTVVNVGSVGRPFEDNVRSVYIVLDLTEISQKKFSVEHRYAKYDHEKAAEDLKKCDFEGSSSLAYMLKKATDKFPETVEL